MDKTRRKKSAHNSNNDTFIKILGVMMGGVLNIVILALTVFGIYYFTKLAFAKGIDMGLEMTSVKPYEEVEVTIEKGASVEEVAEILEKNGLIPSALMYRLENMLKNNTDPYPGGTFVLNTEMDNSQLHSALWNVVVYGTDITITIPEGYTLKEIALLLESKELVETDKFIEACDTLELDYDFLSEVPERANRLEGYLFPDTYRFAEKSTPEQIIRKLLTRYQEICTAEYEDRANQLGLSMDQVITIASIIEKEAKLNSERPLVSEVIHNRLEQDMKLQMCSTVLYALDKRKDRLLLEDLGVDSPYNTYLYGGLPAGPISNPGQASINAALYPETGDLLYFVIKNEETGEHVFTNNEEDFLKAKEKYNQQF